MLEKDPAKRISVNDMKKDAWVNDGFAISLESKEADFMANLTEAELKSKKIPG